MKIHNRLLFIYSLNQGIHWFAVGIVAPVMILVLLDMGFNIAQVGTIMAVMGTTVMVLELPTGGVADSIGRKRVYMLAVAFYMTGYAVILFAQSFYLLFISVFLLGAGRALSSGSMEAWFVDGCKKEGMDDSQLQQALAKAGVVIPAALGAGTLAGGFIPDLTGSYRSNIAVLVGIYALQIILTGIMVKEDRSKFSGRILDGFRAFPHVISSAVQYGFKSRNTLIILIATFGLGIGLSGLEQLWQPKLRMLSPETGSWLLGVVSSGYFVCAAGGSALSVYVVKLFKNRYAFVLFVSRLIMSVMYIALSFMYSIEGFIPLYLLIMLANGLNGSPEMTVFNRDIPSERRSTLLSLNSLFLQFGGASGSLLAGFLAYRSGIGTSWLVAGLALAVLSFIYLFLKEKPVEDRV